jgi:hypothetical protein
MGMAAQLAVMKKTRDKCGDGADKSAALDSEHFPGDVLLVINA